MLISRGNPILMGVNEINNTYNFSIVSELDDIKLMLFKKDSKASAGMEKCNAEYVIDLDSSFKSGDVFSCAVSGVELKDYLYCYQSGGTYMVDPYAKAVTDCEEFGIKKENAKYLSPVCLEKYDWEGDTPLNIPLCDSIIYKLNVRGFTKSRTSKVKNKGTFAGIIEKTDYLKEIGITTIELMPAYEFDEIGRFPQLDEDYSRAKQGVDSKYWSVSVDRPVNYWGYVKGFYFAPKAAFCSKAGIVGAKGKGTDVRLFTDYTTEYKDFIKTMHVNGIEVIMEMFFADMSTGAALDCLRYWMTEYHVDGFHLYCDEATLKAAIEDPVLSQCKIFTVYWDGQRGKMKHVASYNNDYQNIARRFLKGDENMLSEYVNASRKNPSNAAVINYITNNNGFTLNDLVSYDRKHNELNGESNRDGENFNFSWNCGEEGPSKKKKIKDLRIKQIKNAFMMEMLSAGTPLILAGDEFANSQNGNNNPYCVDSEVSWINWKDSAAALEIFDFVKRLIRFRKEFRILHMPDALTMSDRTSCGYPDLSFHSNNAWYAGMENYNRHIGIMYGQEIADNNQKKLIYVAYNMHWESHQLALPKLEGGSKWKVIICSGTDKEEACVDDMSRNVIMAPRSIAVLTGEYKLLPVRKKKVKEKNGRK
ncbi:MAG: hypothetical protein ACI4E1_01640 [Lachnospira sp.]